MIAKRFSRKAIYESDWVNLYVDKVQYPDGTMIDQYHVLHYDHESVGVVITNEKQEILMIKANRYVTNEMGWEIPAGRIEDGESCIDAAARETIEETGCKVGEIQFLGRYNPNNGMSDMTFNICKSKVLSEGYDFDHNEVSEKRWFSISELKSMIRNNEIHCGLSITGLLWYMLDQDC